MKFSTRKFLPPVIRFSAYSDVPPAYRSVLYIECIAISGCKTLSRVTVLGYLVRHRAFHDDVCLVPSSYVILRTIVAPHFTLIDVCPPVDVLSSLLALVCRVDGLDVEEQWTFFAFRTSTVPCLLGVHCPYRGKRFHLLRRRPFVPWFHIVSPFHFRLCQVPSRCRWKSSRWRHHRYC